MLSSFHHPNPYSHRGSIVSLVPNPFARPLSTGASFLLGLSLSRLPNGKHKRPLQSRRHASK